MQISITFISNSIFYFSYNSTNRLKILNLSLIFDNREGALKNLMYFDHDFLKNKSPIGGHMLPEVFYSDGAAMASLIPLFPCVPVCKYSGDVPGVVDP